MQRTKTVFAGNWTATYPRVLYPKSSGQFFLSNAGINLCKYTNFWILTLILTFNCIPLSPFPFIFPGDRHDAESLIWFLETPIWWQVWAGPLGGKERSWGKPRNLMTTSMWFQEKIQVGVIRYGRVATEFQPSRILEVFLHFTDYKTFSPLSSRRWRFLFEIKTERS